MYSRARTFVQAASGGVTLEVSIHALSDKDLVHAEKHLTGDWLAASNFTRAVLVFDCAQERVPVLGQYGKGCEGRGIYGVCPGLLVRGVVVLFCGRGCVFFVCAIAISSLCGSRQAGEVAVYLATAVCWG